MNYSNSSRLSYNPSQVSADRAVLEQAVQAKTVLKPAADALYKIWEHISRQLEICESKVEAFDLRRGFFALPDEILSTVLEYAAQPGGEDDYEEDYKDDEDKLVIRVVKSATKLSHVCKRFRGLITRSPCLWNRVFNGMGEIDMVSTCLSRCKRGNGEVSLAAPLFESLRNRHNEIPFIRIVSKLAENWGSFLLQGDGENEPPFNPYASIQGHQSNSGIRRASQTSRSAQPNAAHHSLSACCNEIDDTRRPKISQCDAFLLELVNTQATVLIRQ